MYYCPGRSAVALIHIKFQTNTPQRLPIETTENSNGRNGRIGQGNEVLSFFPSLSRLEIWPAEEPAPPLALM